MMLSLLIKHAASFWKQTDDAKGYKEFDIGYKRDMSSEIAEVIIILGYATDRSKEVTGKYKSDFTPACVWNQH